MEKIAAKFELGTVYTLYQEYYKAKGGSKKGWSMQNSAPQSIKKLVIESGMVHKSSTSI